MDRDALVRWLEISQARLDDLLAAGLPMREGGTFDPYAVTAWLEAENLGKRHSLTGKVATLREVAKAFGVSLHTVKKDWRGGGMPGTNGNWDLGEISEWRQLAQRFAPDQAAVNANGDHDPDAGKKVDSHAELRRRLEADVRIREAEARKRERQELIAQGNMIAKDLVERLWAEQVIAARERFKRLPNLMEPMFPRKQSPQYVAEMNAHIDVILNDLAEFHPSAEVPTEVADE